jgi:hypothetical protein
MLKRLAAAAVIGGLAVPAASDGAIDKVPATCRDAGAPRLCAIHSHYRKVTFYRTQMGLASAPYRWRAERLPATRTRILTYWTRTQVTMRQRFQRYQRSRATMAIPAAVRSTLLCIHPYEEPSWSTAAGGLGFVYPPSTYVSEVHPSYRARVAALVASYGDSWYSWPAEAQLVVGTGLVLNYGYSPWTTAGNCT